MQPVQQITVLTISIREFVGPKRLVVGQQHAEFVTGSCYFNCYTHRVVTPVSKVSLQILFHERSNHEESFRAMRINYKNLVKQTRAYRQLPPSR